MADELEKQIKEEESQYSRTLSTILTRALNTKEVIAEADKLNKTSGGWPYPPDAKMLKLYNTALEKEWKKVQRDYTAFNTRLNIEAKKGKDPKVNAVLKYDGSFKGGKSYKLNKGDTITSVAKDTYGFDCYAKQVWEANEKVLGPSCTEVPAGWGIELPKIWVPAWVEEPSVKLPAGVEAKAEKIKIPSLSFTVSHSNVTKTTLNLGGVIVEVTVTITGSVTMTHDGGIDVTFDARKFSASLTRALGPLSGNYSISMEGADTKATLSVVNLNVNGVKFSGSLALGMGSLVVNLGTSVVKRTDGDLTVECSLKSSAELKVRPNPKSQEAYEASFAANAVVVIILGYIVVKSAGPALRSAPGAAKAVKEIFEGIGKYVDKMPKGLPAPSGG